MGQLYEDSGQELKKKTPVFMWVGIGLLFLPLFVYILTLCPTVFVGDAGDFLTASYTLGVPHPPGYPTYTMLGHLFMNLPIDGGMSAPAWRMNLMSAIAAWAACVFLFLYLRRILKTEWAALAGAMTFAFTRQFWQHAEIAEVYTLEIMFLALILYLSAIYVQERQLKWAYLLAFFMGLALSHHYVVLIYYPGILIYVALNGGLRFKAFHWAFLILVAFIGLLPYAYLPLVKYKTPNGEIVFVKTEEERDKYPSSVVAVLDTPAEYFFNYVTRRFYSQARVYTNSPEALPERTTTPMVFKRFVEVAVEDFGYPMIVFGWLGWFGLLLSWIYHVRNKKKTVTLEEMGMKAEMLPAALGYIIYFLIVHFYPSGDILAAPLENIAVVIPPLLIPLSFGFVMIVAFGMDFSQRMIKKYVASQSSGDVLKNPKFRTFSGLLVIASFFLVFLLLYINSRFCDKSDAVVSYNYTLNVLDTCEPNSILLTTGDETFLFWYVQYCEPSHDPDDPTPGYRKDVWATNWIHNLTELSLLSNELNAMRVVMEQFIINSGYYFPDKSNYYGPRPIATTFIPSTFAESSLIMQLECVLDGLTYNYRLPGDIPDLSDPLIRGEAKLDAIVEGVETLSVVDYFNAKPFEQYRWDGLPGFEGTNLELANIDTAEYRNFSLEPQEMEVVGRYQDAFYRFGIQAMFDENPEIFANAWKFFFRAISLDPDNSFGWKELGDCFLSIGQLDRAADAYQQLNEIALSERNIKLEAESLSGMSYVELMKRNLDESEKFANHALLLDKNQTRAQRILEEIDRQRSAQVPESSESTVMDEPIIDENEDDDKPPNQLEQLPTP